MSGPKKSDYKASESENVSAAVSLKQKDFFDKNIMPLLEGDLLRASTEDQISYSEGIRNLDVMSGITENLANLGVAKGIETSADIASLSVGQAIDAQKTGKLSETTDLLSGVKAGQGFQSQTMGNMRYAANIDTYDTIQAGKRKQSRDQQLFKSAAPFVKEYGSFVGDNFRSLAKTDDQGRSIEDPTKQLRDPDQSYLGAGFFGIREPKIPT